MLIHEDSDSLVPSNGEKQWIVRREVSHVIYFFIWFSVLLMQPSSAMKKMTKRDLSDIKLFNQPPRAFEPWHTLFQLPPASQCSALSCTHEPQGIFCVFCTIPRGSFVEDQSYHVRCSLWLCFAFIHPHHHVLSRTTILTYSHLPLSHTLHLSSFDLSSFGFVLITVKILLQLLTCKVNWDVIYCMLSHYCQLFTIMTLVCQLNFCILAKSVLMCILVYYILKGHRVINDVKTSLIKTKSQYDVLIRLFKEKPSFNCDTKAWPTIFLL